MNLPAHGRSAAVALVLAVLALGSMDGSEGGDPIAEAERQIEDGELALEEARMRQEIEAELQAEGDRRRLGGGRAAGGRSPGDAAGSDARTRTTTIRTDLPAVLATLSDEGYTTDQRDALFERDFEDRWFLVEGRIKDVGTWMGRKYVTIEVSPENLCDVYFDDSFDILSVRKGGSGRFVGTFSFLGTGVMFHRQFEDGRAAPADLGSSDSALPPAATPSPASSAPPAGPQVEMRRIIARLWDGSLSFDQREELFDREHKGRQVKVRGRISDVGTWLGEKYVTIDLGEGHLVDVYPSGDFDLLSVRTGETREFVGRFEFLGVPEMFHHRVESAEPAR